METRSGDKYKEYRRLSNRVKNLTKKAKKKMEREIAKESKTNPKKFWQYVNKKNKIKQGIPDLVYEDDDGEETSTTNDKEKAEVLADFFSSVFTKENTNNIPKMTQRNFKEWLTSMEISKERIKKKILQLKVSKAPGPDGLHPRLLKELAQQLATPLEVIFQLSLSQGKVRSDWTKGEITAIHKKGSRRSAGNYRPVSLTCITCKIMESLIRETIIDHMRNNKLFSKYQYGFINRRSTTLQLLYVLDEWTEILDQGGTIDTVYLDFMKAFDKVPHERLLHKLQYYGIDGPIHRWIRSFLTGRVQRVKVDSAASEWRNVTSGIPQGSVLGPILFVIYINDMPEAVKNASTAAMFADDTKLYRRTDTPNGPAELQEDLDCIFNWSDTWQMKFQPTKCKVLSLGNRQENEIPKLYLYSRKEDGSLEKVQLEQTEVEKDIGVYVDQELNFKEQITSKTNKANSTMGIIRWTIDHLDRRTFTQLYKSLVRPHLEVSNSAWFPYKKQDIELIESVQRTATRQIPGYNQLEYEERLRLLGLPSLTFRRLRGDMIETYKILAGVYDEDVGPKLPKGNSTTRGHSKKIFKRGSRLNIRKYFFTLRVTTIWNELPEDIVNAKNTQAFKNALDKHWKNHPSKFNYLHNPYSNPC